MSGGYQPGQYGNQFQNSNSADDNNDGWGVDSDIYTTKLDQNKLSQAQIEMAIQLEREILKESSAGGGAYEYEYTEEEDPYYTGGNTEPIGLPNSAEEAMQMLAQRSRLQQPSQQQQQQPVQQQPVQQQQRQQRLPPQSQLLQPVSKRQYGSAEDEIRAYHELCKQYRIVQINLARVGEPTPSQKKSFLQNLTRGLIKCLRYPVPDVRAAVSGMFLEIGWDVRRNRSPPNVRTPPTGAMMQELLAKTVDFFGGRHNLQKRSKYTLPTRNNTMRPRNSQPNGRQSYQRGGQSNYTNQQTGGPRNNRYNNNYRGGRGGGRNYRRNQPQQNRSGNTSTARRSNKPYIHRNNNNSQPRHRAGPQ
jgi:hypothetical protein